MVGGRKFRSKPFGLRLGIDCLYTVLKPSNPCELRAGLTVMTGASENDELAVMTGASIIKPPHFTE